ncbi:MAG: hypothetical protein ACRDRX_26240, partial [Pseudonocardiaceae bacterium]
MITIKDLVAMMVPHAVATRLVEVCTLVVATGSPSGVELTAGQLRSDGVRRERDTTDLPGAKNVADV